MFIALKNNMQRTYNLSYMKNDMFITNPKWQIITNCYWFVISGQKNNFSCGFKLNLITIYYLKFVKKNVIKILWMYNFISFILLKVLIINKYVVKKSRRLQISFFLKNPKCIFLLTPKNIFWPALHIYHLKWNRVGCQINCQRKNN